MGKTVAAKDVFDTAGAVFARPDIQFIPERVVLIAEYNTILESGHLSSLKKTSPAVTMVLMFIAHSNAVSDSVTFSLVFNQRPIRTTEQKKRLLREAVKNYLADFFC